MTGRALRRGRADSSWKSARQYPFDLGFLLGVAVSALVYLFIAHGSFPLTARSGRQHFYTAAAIALLHGRLDVAPDILDGECFLIHHRCYGYFGITPSLIRLPLALVAGNRMVNNSVEEFFFVLGFLTLAAGVWWLSRLLVALWAPDLAPRSQRLIGFVAAVAALGASPVLFLISRTMVYEEAILWGVAFATIGLSSAISARLHPRASTFAVLIAADFLAVSARPSVGASALFATVVVGIWLYRRSGRRAWGILLIASAVAAFGSAPAMAAAKFGTLSPPYQYHVNISKYPSVERLLSHPGGINVVVLPTKVVSLLRPDSVDLSLHTPFVRLGETQPTILPPAKASDVYWELTASIPATMPFSALMAVAGLVALILEIRRRVSSRSPNPRLEVTTVVLIGALGALTIELAFPGQSYRYLADCLPVVYVLTAVGLAAWAARPPVTLRVSVAIAAVACLLLVAQFVIQGGVAIENALTNQGEVAAACPGPPNPYGLVGRLFCPAPRK